MMCYTTRIGKAGEKAGTDRNGQRPVATPCAAGRSGSGARREEQAPDGQPTLGNVRNLAYMARTGSRLHDTHCKTCDYFKKYT